MLDPRRHLGPHLLTSRRDHDRTRMQRLYLASHRFDSLSSFLGAAPRDLRIGLVPTAMSVVEDRSSLEEDLGALDAMGFAVERIELQGMHSRELARQARHRAVLERDAGHGRVVARAIEVRGGRWRIVAVG